MYALIFNRTDLQSAPRLQTKEWEKQETEKITRPHSDRSMSSTYNAEGVSVPEVIEQSDESCGRIPSGETSAELSNIRNDHNRVVSVSLCNAAEHVSKQFLETKENNNEKIKLKLN